MRHILNLLHKQKGTSSISTKKVVRNYLKNIQMCQVSHPTNQQSSASSHCFSDIQLCISQRCPIHVSQNEHTEIDCLLLLLTTPGLSARLYIYEHKTGFIFQNNCTASLLSNFLIIETYLELSFYLFLVQKL